MAKMKIEMDLKEGKTVKEVLSSVKINGKDLSEYKYENIKLYNGKKYSNDEKNICDIHKEKELSSDYVIKKDEVYALGITAFDLKQIDKEDPAALVQSCERIFINGTDICDLESTCGNANAKNDKLEDLSFLIKEVEEKEETVTTTSEEVTTNENDTLTTGTDLTTGVDSSNETVTQELVKPEETVVETNNTKVYALVGVIIALVIIIGILIYKLSRTGNVEQ